VITCEIKTLILFQKYANNFITHVTTALMTHFQIPWYSWLVRSTRLYVLQSIESASVGENRFEKETELKCVVVVSVQLDKMNCDCVGTPAICQRGPARLRRYIAVVPGMETGRCQRVYGQRHGWLSFRSSDPR